MCGQRMPNANKERREMETHKCQSFGPYHEWPFEDTQGRLSH